MSLAQPFVNFNQLFISNIQPSLLLLNADDLDDFVEEIITSRLIEIIKSQYPNVATAIDQVDTVSVEITETNVIIILYNEDDGVNFIEEETFYIDSSHYNEILIFLRGAFFRSATRFEIPEYLYYIMTPEKRNELDNKINNMGTNQLFTYQDRIINRRPTIFDFFSISDYNPLYEIYTNAIENGTYPNDTFLLLFESVDRFVNQCISVNEDTGDLEIEDTQSDVEIPTYVDYEFYNISIR